MTAPLLALALTAAHQIGAPVPPLPCGQWFIENAIDEPDGRTVVYAEPHASPRAVWVYHCVAPLKPWMSERPAFCQTPAPPSDGGWFRWPKQHKPFVGLITAIREDCNEPDREPVA